MLPFFAASAHLRPENDFGGNVTVETGLQWPGRNGHLFRVGVQCFNGMSEQGQFFQRFEEQLASVCGTTFRGSLYWFWPRHSG
jgi:hypothetical protein